MRKIQYTQNMNFFRKIVVFIILLICSSKICFASPPQEGFADIVEPLMPAVVNINTVKYAKSNQGKRPFGKENFPNGHPFNELFEHFGFQFFMDEMPSNPKATSLGSGFLISSDGEIVTNHHVIADADEISVKLNNNKEYKAKLVGSDPRTDVALLKIDSTEPLPFVRLGDSSKSRVGDWVIAIGNPFGLGGTVTSGIISSKSRDIDIISGGLIDDYIQTDASINGGNSGGPMFNLQGEVIGVNTAILTPSGANIGIGFAIPSNSVQNVVKQLKTSGKIERGRLGIKIQELTPEIAEGLELKDIEGVIVIDVDPDSAGAKSGLKSQDIITEYDGHPIKSTRKFQILVAETPVKKSVKIKILRNNKEQILNAKVESAKDPESAKDKEAELGDNDSKSFTVNGVKFANTKVLDSDKTEGVVVVANNAQDNWKTLINKGDIVVAVNQVQIKDLSDFKSEYNKTVKSGKKNIVFLIKRGQMTVYLALPLKE
ncbi:MAG: Do family serine endopeptidase [Rickettsiaceae bacterium]|nr:Do family serine endopeptidase [Rickettsiaceae bacterium]